MPCQDPIKVGVADAGVPATPSGALFRAGRLGPEIDVAFDRMGIDLGQFLGGKGQVVQGCHVFHDLLGSTGADQGAGDARIAQGPGQGQLRQALAAALGDGIQARTRARFSSDR